MGLRQAAMPDRRPHPTTDQAAGLRRLFGAPDKGLRLHPLVTPENGGDQLGFAVGLAAALVRQGRRVLILDGEDGRIAPILGLKARYDLRHVLIGERNAETVALPASAGYRVLPAVRALQDAMRSQAACMDLQRWLTGTARDADVVLACTTVETVAPLMIDEAQELLLVCGAEPWQLARTYARIKLLHDCYPSRRFRIAYCPAESSRRAEDAHARLARATTLYLGLAIEYGGAIPGPRAQQYRRSESLERAAASGLDGVSQQAFDDVAASLFIQGPPLASAPAAPVSPDPADAAFFSVVESIADVYGPRHA